MMPGSTGPVRPCAFNDRDFQVLVPAVQRGNVSTSAEYDLTEHTTAYVESIFSHMRARQHLWPFFVPPPFAIIVPADHVDNPFGAGRRLQRPRDGQAHASRRRRRHVAHRGRSRATSRASARARCSRTGSGSSADVEASAATGPYHRHAQARAAGRAQQLLRPGRSLRLLQPVLFVGRRHRHAEQRRRDRQLHGRIDRRSPTTACARTTPA